MNDYADYIKKFRLTEHFKTGSIKSLTLLVMFGVISPFTNLTLVTHGSLIEISLGLKRGLKAWIEI